MLLENDVNYSTNIFLHVFILFTFLTIFFFTFISNLTKQNVQDAFSDIIDKEVEQLLTGLDGWDKRANPKNYPNIDYVQLDDLAKKIIANARDGDAAINKNNTRLLWIGIGSVIGLFVLMTAFVLYFSKVKKYNIHLGKTILENIVMFTLVGGIEVYFFLKIVSKYIPVTPDYVGKTILERIKYHITQKNNV